MKCKYEHDDDCCNSGATQYMSKCRQPCEYIIPPTNADRIRAMSDEELAVKLNGGCPPTRTEGDVCYEQKTCTKCWLDWLKQPYKEE